MLVRVSRTNIDIDDELIERVMRIHRLKTKRAAVDFALRRLDVTPLTLEEKLAMRGRGWGDGLSLDALRDATEPRGL
jgi:Arc/MetJ family transcription regulator